MRRVIFSIIYSSILTEEYLSSGPSILQILSENNNDYSQRLRWQQEVKTK